MTDLEIILGHHGEAITAWLEGRKFRKVEELIGLDRRKEETLFTRAELLVLSDLISEIKAKQKKLTGERAKERT